MPETALGNFLRALRERRGLSLREAGQLSGVDHAYIYRLETGAKDAPSPDLLAKLVKVLRPERRESDMLAYVADHPHTDPRLMAKCLDDLSISIAEFAMLAGAVYRGSPRPDYDTMLARIRRILADEENHG